MCKARLCVHASESKSSCYHLRLNAAKSKYLFSERRTLHEFSTFVKAGQSKSYNVSVIQEYSNVDKRIIKSASGKLWRGFADVQNENVRVL